MGLLDLFRPKWKHSDATIRLEAVKALISEDLPILTQVLRHDRDVRVRRAALKKVQDAELLSELADKDPDEALRRDAADKASELWLDAALDKDDEALALSAVDRLLGQRALTEVACRAHFPAVQKAALALLKDKDKDDRARAEIARRSDDPALRTAAAAAIRDEEVLRDLLCADANRELLLSLLDRVKSPEALEQIARRAKVKAVAKAARERAEAGRPRGPVTAPASANAAAPAGTKAGKAAAPAAAVSPREELCRRLEAAAKTQDFEDADDFLTGLRAEWQKLGPLPSSDALQKRFERAAARYNERRDAFQKKLQKQRGPQQQPAPVKAPVVAPPAQPSPAELARREAEAQRKREREREEEERRAAQQKERAEEQQRLDAQRALRDAERKVQKAEQEAQLRANEEKRAAEQKERDDKQQQNLQKAVAECQKLEDLAQREEVTVKQAEQGLKQAHEVLVAANPLPRTDAHKVRARYDAARAKLVIRLHELREREDWLRFSNVPKLEALVQHAEQLLAAAGHEDADHNKVAAALKALQAEWKTVGPAPKEKSEALWQRFKSLCDQIYERTKTASDEERAENLRKKEELVAQLEGISQKLESISDWKATGEAVKKLQADWKALGPVPGAQREQAEALWTRFKAACDAFFEKRKGHYAELDEDRAQNQRKKEELCIRVERLAIAPSADLKAAAEQIKRYQAEWKEIGPAPKEHNDELWQRFRKACDAFFDKRKAAFAAQEGERLANQKKKEALCEKAEELARREDANQDAVESELKQLGAEWKRIGPAPREVQEELWQRFRKAADAVFGRGREAIELPPDTGGRFENKALAGLAARLQASDAAGTDADADSEEPADTGKRTAGKARSELAARLEISDAAGTDAAQAEDSGADEPPARAAKESESAVSPSAISGSWVEAANSEWGEIDERISSGLTPQPDESEAGDGDGTKSRAG
ncbi:MAG: DUF349 domain-containing protein [Polyangia bacterium]